MEYGELVSNANPEIRVEGLGVCYGRVQALDDVNCTFSAGITGVLGPNGAGKSTLFNALTNVLTPSSGRIFRDGVLLDTPGAWRRHLERLGYLPQDPGWFDGFSVMELCLYMAGLRAVPARQRRAAAEAAVASVGLSKQSSTRLKALSGGMRRRAFLAQAIVHDPPVVLLDEPTSGLDPVQRLHLRELLAEMGRQRAIVLSTHLVEDVAHIASDILVLDRGHLVWSGTPERLAALGATADSDGLSAATPWEQGFMSVLSTGDET